MGGLQNNLGSKNRTRRLNARVNTVRLGARTLEKKTIIIKIFSPPPEKKPSNLFARWTTSASWYDHIGVLASWTSPSLLLTRLLHRRARAAADVAAALLDLAPLLVLMLLVLMALEVLRVVGWEGPGG